MPPRRSAAAETKPSSKKAKVEEPQTKRVTRGRSTSKAPSSAAPKGKEGIKDLKGFKTKTNDLRIEIANKEGDVLADLPVPVKEFSSGSFGWAASKNCKLPLDKSDEEVDVTITLNITVHGSKPKATNNKASSSKPTSSSKTAKPNGQTRGSAGSADKKRKAGSEDEEEEDGDEGMTDQDDDDEEGGGEGEEED